MAQSDGEVTISEFMTSNTGFLRDQDGDSPDWIELFNGRSVPVDLEGWFLTDDRARPARWMFPKTNLASNARLIVFASSKDRRVPGSELHSNFSLDSKGEYLGLFDPRTNKVSEFAPVFPPQVANVSFGVGAGLTNGPTDPETWRYFPIPTATRTNNFGVKVLGPLLHNLAHFPNEPADDEAVLVTVKASAAFAPVSSLLLTYRTMFSNEVSTAMFDDGLHGDGLANDGTFAATIPANVSLPGEMIRYRVSAMDSLSRTSQWPAFFDPRGSPQYQGTVVRNPGLTNPLPVLHWFVQNRTAAETSVGTRCSIFYAGEFYDNIFVRIRGGTSLGWPKHSYKFEMNEGEHFRLRYDLERVSEFDVNTTYTDKSYNRAVMHYELQRDAGMPSPETFHMRVQQNNLFFSVALYTEQPDSDFLRRHGFDDQGALYKGGPGSTYESAGSFEKKTRRTENSADLQALLTGLRLSGTALENFVFDNLDLPLMVNYMATVAIAQNIDGSDKNHFLYRDTRGSREWFMLPWDLDLSFGPNALNTDVIVYNQNYTSHPFIGVRPYMLHDGKYNRLLEAVFKVPRAREMVNRRVRTLADQFLASGYFSNRIDALLSVLVPDVDLDRAKWRNNAHFPGTTYTLKAANDRIKSDYLRARWGYLTAKNIPGITTNNPGAQPGDVSILIARVEADPLSGNQEQEFVELRNTNMFPVELTGWRVSGVIQHRFKAGTVIPSTNSLFLTPNATAFRARTVEPRGAQGLFVQGGYEGRLPARGGKLEIFDPTSRLVTTLTYPGAPTAVQQFLRVVEIMYNPAAFTGDLYPAQDYEYIALQNAGERTLDLAGVRFAAGISFSFSAGAVTNLAPGATVYVVKNRAAFKARYGNSFSITGDYTGQLDNNGEAIRLEDGGGKIVELGYDEQWEPMSDGRGAALAIQQPDPAVPDTFTWQRSRGPYGEPSLQDSDKDGIADFHELLFGSDPASMASKPGFERIQVNPGSLNLRFWAQANRNYRVATTRALNEPWLTLAVIAPKNEGRTEDVTVSRPNGASGFFRLEIVP